ncbi:hypothetical protein BH18ACI5_BH18ACI5_13150 [soil metagenome]
MKGNRAAVAAVIVVALVITGFWLFKRGGGTAAVDLIEQFQTAEKRPPGGTFEVIEAELDGVTHKAIFTLPESRIIWKLRVPDDAWLRLNVGMKPESWTKEGDGVLFHVGVSDGRSFDQLFIQHVNPYLNAGERRWIPVVVDLAPYAGEEISLIFNTNNSQPGKGDDDRNDLALWGAPMITTK